MVGWTTHHSIDEIEGRLYLLYHDSVISGGKIQLKCIKVMELKYKNIGTIETIDVMS